MDYRRLEPPWSTSSDGDFRRAPQTLFVRSTPASSAQPRLTPCGVRQGFCGLRHSWFRRAADTSSWRRSRARTFDCRSHDNYNRRHIDLTGSYIRLNLLFLNNLRLLNVELALSLPEHHHLQVVEGKSAAVASEHALDGPASSHLLLETPLDAKHSPVGLNRDRCQPFLLTVLLSVTRQIKLQSANALQISIGPVP